MALETKDPKSVLSSIINTIQSCVTDPIDINKLSTFDIEYIFIQIRGKSVGESSDVTYPCEKCEQPNELKVGLHDLEVDLTNAPDSKIELSEDYVLNMKYPGYNNLIHNINYESETKVSENIFQLIKSCMDTLMTPDDIINLQEEDPEELDSFIDSLTTEQLEKIMNFVQNIPTVSKEVFFNCANCGTPNTITLKGINDFF